jgi:hypothetical protein
MDKIKLVWIWVIFNIFIGIYEIYCYKNRNLLSLERIPKWNSSVIASWNEYCRVDPRYILKEYVWTFELLNAFYAFLLIYILLYNQELIKYILLLEIISCVLYFLTLIYEVLSDKIIRYNILKKSTITNRFLYYGISSIWIIVPVYLYSLF